MSDQVSVRRKISAVWQVLKFRPFLTLSIIIGGSAVALFEAAGLSFIQPIFDISSTETGNYSTLTQGFGALYSYFGIELNLNTLIIGVSSVMILRYSSSFIVAWLKIILSKNYGAELKKKAFEQALDSKIAYFDKKGSDEILNHIVTEIGYTSKVISISVSIMQRIFLLTIYLAIMAYLSIYLTAVTFLLLAFVTGLIRFGLRPAFEYGSKVADANEKLQEVFQAGTKGIREVKNFGLETELYSRCRGYIEEAKENGIVLSRNEKFIHNFYRMSASLTIFVIIYIGLSYTQLGFGELGIFLAALYRMSSKISSLNSQIYRLEGYLPHFDRTMNFLDELEKERESKTGEKISSIQNIEFNDVSFSYEDGEKAIENVSFKVNKGDFIAFVGKSGAGKSTIVSLIARNYTPDEGTITTDSVPIQKYCVDDWRSRIAVVRQQAFIFNTTLEDNIRVGKEDASIEEVRQVCKVAKVDEFLDSLPNGLKTEIGDNGIKLSGGQRQRVAIARALLKDADYLILDEATSDLDSHLEKEIHSSIEEFGEDYGIIAIAHRLSTLENAEKIYSLEQGNIVEEGNHRSLIQNKGVYSKLYNIQN